MGGDVRIDPHAYEMSRKIDTEDYPFYALIMAAMRQADTRNAAKLREAFPDTWAYIEHAYNCVGCTQCGRVGSDKS